MTHEVTFFESRRHVVATALAAIAFIWALGWGLAWALLSWHLNEVEGSLGRFMLIVCLIAAGSCLAGVLLLRVPHFAARLAVGLLAVVLLLTSFVGVGAFIFLLPSAGLMALAFYVGLHEIAYP